MAKAVTQRRYVPFLARVIGPRVTGIASQVTGLPDFDKYFCRDELSIFNSF